MESTFTDFGVAIHQHWLIWLWKCNLINNLITVVGNDLEIREGIANLNSQQVANEMAIRKINWKFSPPSAPHFGGVWERVVQSAKRALKIILQDQTVTDEVLSTVLSEVTSILNGRILTSVSADPQDPAPLTPNHFLLGVPILMYRRAQRTPSTQFHGDGGFRPNTSSTNSGNAGSENMSLPWWKGKNGSPIKETCRLETKCSSLVTICDEENGWSGL